MPQITIHTNAPLVAANLENLAVEVPEISRSRIYGRAQAIIKAMQKSGSPITYPVKWDSDKQRRAFFATDGFGGGIPSVRSGDYQRGWGEPVRLEDGYRITNKTAGAQYIGGNAYGQRQSRIHQGRWPLLRDVVEQKIDQLPEEIRDEIILVARRKGFQ